MLNESAKPLVFVTKVPTRNGNRIEIVAGRSGATVLLDPLQLESLTWQSAETFTLWRLAAADDMADRTCRYTPHTQGEKVTSIDFGNEFATVRLNRVNVDESTDRLEIVAPKLGGSVRLSIVDLEALALQTKESLSQLLEYPYGAGVR
ncbi:MULTISPECIES: hypothetical protein [unclassified Mycobacterium]|uniref:hypothetical protein n=1 Tax=unclassified Mycobacterium TaxID=2642494 RepID=UPI0029C9A356|nr:MULTISPECIES: hypothetical protein [unclassified Mycobacterium]